MVLALNSNSKRWRKTKMSSPSAILPMAEERESGLSRVCGTGAAG